MVRNQADRARRCFCERESEPVISRIGYVLHAYVHMHTHACPMPVEEGKKKASGLDNRGRGPFSEVSLHVRTDKIGSKIQASRRTTCDRSTQTE